MPIFRLISPKWTNLKTLEGEFTDAQIKGYNAQGYNIFYLPNTPGAEYGSPITGADIVHFDWCFVDWDSKDETYPSKDAFLEAVGASNITPTKVIDSGNGIHVYWRVQNLDAIAYLRFQRRLMRLFKTDEAVGQIFQLMRYPGTINTKVKDSPVDCVELFTSDTVYTAEEFDGLLPSIKLEDEAYCKMHFDKTYNINQTVINEELPPKFGKLLRDNPEAKTLWTETTEDRSKADFRLGHLMFASGFTKEEAASVLVNSSKALQRAPIHRNNYAQNIVDKIYTFETEKTGLDLSSSVREILSRSGTTLNGTTFRCHPRIDNTVHGFRLGQVLGLVAGSGVGKTAFALNMFRWFAQTNPDYHHFFVPLEQPANEIASRWRTMCGADTSLHDKVHVLSNYDEEGNFRHLSFDEIREYIERFQKVTGNKVGSVVIDHIGALKKKGKDGENQDLMEICHAMKSFAVSTNTFLVMQSQSSRDKAGIGDLELNKDAAYGTMYFEAYCDYLVTLWQPLKRVYKLGAPTLMAYKFCKIRHKKQNSDIIQEDVPYSLLFETETECLRELSELEEKSLSYWVAQATNRRKSDRKTDLVEYTSVKVTTNA